MSKGDLWVFGYGSLMWRPGFEFIEQVPARLIGEHRALCVYSFDHRGTPEKPGLVLGLDRGGACRGVAFRVAAKQRDDVVDYLRSREQTTHVYREVMRSVWLENEARERGQRAGLCGRSRPCAICRAAVAGRTTALRATGPRPFRQQPRLRAGDGEVDRGAGFRATRSYASAGGDAAWGCAGCIDRVRTQALSRPGVQDPTRLASAERGLSAGIAAESARPLPSTIVEPSHQALLHRPLRLDDPVPRPTCRAHRSRENDQGLARPSPATFVDLDHGLRTWRGSSSRQPRRRGGAHIY